MEETIEKIYAYLAAYGLNILAALAIFIIGKWIARTISNGVEKVMQKKSVDPALVGFLKNLLYFGLFAFVCLAALAKLGIQTASFIAVLGAAGLAVGMALQGSLSNFAAGVMIIIFKPFKVGDFVAIAGTKGAVQEIQIFNTLLNTPDNVRIIVPNAQAIGGIIENYAANDTRRVDFVVGISYEDDIAKARKVLGDVVATETRVLKDPAVTIAVSELGDSSVNFVVRPWVNKADYWDVYFNLTEQFKLALDKNNISIPYPQRDVHVKGNISEVKGEQAVSSSA